MVQYLQIENVVKLLILIEYYLIFQKNEFKEK